MVGLARQLVAQDGLVRYRTHIFLNVRFNVRLHFTEDVNVSLRRTIT